MLEQAIDGPIEAFTPAAERDRRLGAIGAEVIGYSESGRPIVGLVVGAGPRGATLLSGAHADEPVGSETLLRLAEWQVGDSPEASALRRNWRFHIVAHVNPDGEALNGRWLDAWPDPLACLQHRHREPPGRDVEFAYPDRRPENAVIADFIKPAAPIALHLSLHGMTAATGAWHLIDRPWIDRTADLREAYAQAMGEAGLPLLDWDRGGEKGFEYIAPGFSTTPRGQAMREHFKARGDEVTASQFGDSSMELARQLGGDPLCMVTELPLWLVRSASVRDAPRRPEALFAFQEAVAEARAALERDEVEAAIEAVEGFDLEPVPIETAAKLQLRAIELGLAKAGDAGTGG